MIMYGFLLNLFQFLCDISMNPVYRCNICYAGDIYLKSPNDTNAHYYFHTDNISLCDNYTKFKYNQCFQNNCQFSILNLKKSSKEH